MVADPRGHRIDCEDSPDLRPPVAAGSQRQSTADRNHLLLLASERLTPAELSTLTGYSLRTVQDALKSARRAEAERTRKLTADDWVGLVWSRVVDPAEAPDCTDAEEFAELLVENWPGPLSDLRTRLHERAVRAKTRRIIDAFLDSLPIPKQAMSAEC
jgi:hypothetical protein